MYKYQARSRWVKMLSRCEDEDNIQYKNYGARGIYVCKEWKIFENYYNWLIENNISEDLFVDRIDNNGPYSPENCRVVTRTQNNNNKRNNYMLTWQNESKTIAEWSRDPRCGIKPSSLQKRIRSGWDTESILFTPIKTKVHYHKKSTDPEYEAFGELKTLHLWSIDERCVVSKKTLHYRLKNGWDIEKALTKKTQKKAK